MVIQNFAHTEYDNNNQELTVLSRHSFDKNGLKIVGAVSVVFVQPLGGKNEQYEWQNEDKVSSSLSVITLPGSFTQTIDCNKQRNLNHDNQKGFNHIEYRSDFVSKEALSQENKIPGSSGNIDDEFTKNHNVSIIDFSKQRLDPSLQSRPFSGNPVNQNRNNFKPSSKTVPNISQTRSFNQSAAVRSVHMPNVPTSIPKTVPMVTPVIQDNFQIPRKIPKTVQMVAGEQPLNGADGQHVQKQSSLNIPKVVDAPHERRMLKVKPKFMRIKSLVVTRDKKQDVYCKLCQQKLESCNDIMLHSDQHNLHLTCCVCEAKFGSYCNMRRHCIGHVQSILHKCSLCHCAYKRKDNLNTHIKKHYTTGVSSWRCQVRNSYLRSISQLSKTNTIAKVPKPPIPNSSRMQTQTPLLSSSTSLSSDQFPYPLNTAEKTINSGFDVKKTPDCSMSNSSENHIDLTSDDDLLEVQNVGADKPSSEPENSGLTNPVFTTEPNTCSEIEEMESNASELSTENQSHKPSSSSSDAENLQEKEKVELPKQIMNYTCSSCSLNFEQIDHLKRHILSYHSEEIDPCNDTQNKGDNSNILESDVKMESYDTSQDSQIIDIGKLGEFSHQLAKQLVENVQDNVMGIENSNMVHYSTNENSPKSSQKNSIYHSNMSNYTANENSPSSSQTTAINHSEGKSQINNRSLKKGRSGTSLSSVTPICRVCGFMFNDIQTAVDHKMNHPAEIPSMFGCTICNTDLSSRECLRRHIRSHMGEEHRCTYCHSKYSRLDNLYTHMKNAHGWVKQNKYDRFGNG
ncbi:KRAB [Mytilus coruscus]|uniref:KRAB n=1 Tax=Mytilus coruscus TaxID=42192 RepID=A0A6J8BDC3_MYTCO|nr:KRAB [Mytilus coruscus]